MNLKNKTVLVTGSSSGIGRATAVACAQKQAVVLVHYRKNEKGAKETLDQVNKFSSGQIFKSDLSNPDNVKQLFVQINKEFKSLDCLINNAGLIDNLFAILLRIIPVRAGHILLIWKIGRIRITSEVRADIWIISCFVTKNNSEKYRDEYYWDNEN